MSNSDTFCLKWNEFEKNVSSTLKDFKDDEDFFDVTLACEEEQVQAHKLVLSACSPFFRHVLKKHRPSAPCAGVPLLYLKGVRFKDIVALLKFMYHGEVNVAQDDINQFLATAEELQVKGLTHRDKDQKENEPEESAPGSPPPIDNIRVKSEPSTVSLSATDNSQEGSLPDDEYQDNTLAQHDAAATYQEEIVDYPEGGYGDDAGHWKIDPTTSWKMSNVKAEERHFPCPICHKIFRSRGSLSSHKYSYHKEFSASSQPILQRQMNPLTQPNPLQLLDFQMDTNLEKDRDIECPICHKFFSTRGSLATHKYNYHRNNVNVSFNNPMQQ